MSSRHKASAGALGLGLLAAGISLVAPAAPAHAVTGVFISEIHYDNLDADSGEFVEVTAPAGTNLSGYEVVLYNGSGGASYDTDPLSGVVADQQDGWGTFVADYPSNGIQNGAPDGVALVDNGTVVEFLSYEGTFSATGGPANGATSTDIAVAETGTTPVGHSLQRQANGSWAAPAANTKGVPNGYSAGGDELTATDPADLRLARDEPMAPVQLQASGGTPPYTWTSTTLPAGLTVSASGELSGTPTATGTTEVTFTVTDSATPAATDDVVVSITVEAGPAVVSIADVQGTGSASPRDGEEVVVQGVVTGVYADPYDSEPGMANYGGLDGFYLQTAGTGGTTDSTPGASDAIFVFTGNDLPTGVAVGDSVEVAGTVDEFNTMTEITGPTVTELETPLDPVTGLEIPYPTTGADREAQEGMLLAPTDTFTVTNSYATNQFGEVGLATGDGPLKQPTEHVRDDDTAGLQAIKDENAARAVALDDGTSINYLTNGSAQQDFPLPWLTPTNAPRVGAEATLVAPVILEFRNNIWKFQPQEPVIGDGTDVVTFEDTRADNLAPQDVGGDIQIATFNVLNYFTTTGEQYVANGAGLTPPTHCTYYTDRDNNRIGVNRCGRHNPPGSSQPNDGTGPRGAATQVSFERQQAKIVTAINSMDADIIGLEEIENSIKLPGESNRDEALSALVAALNADAGAGTWKYVRSPAEAMVPAAVGEQDTIRPAFIYRPAEVRPVGQSDILFGTSEFANAREPLAQAFKAVGTADSEAFAVIVNHFKSKGDSDPPATGDNANNPDTGAFNGDRVRQATKLAEFANGFAQARGVEAVFLAGDFNSYTEEDPMHVLYANGYTAIESDTSEESYSFSGLSGSLDHVLGNDAAMEMVTGADIWEINANESVAYQYSRFNYNVTQLFDASSPFAASDHNPEIVGIDAPEPGTTEDIQILATNDFHGRLQNNTSNTEAGAAVLSGAVKQLRDENPNTVFAAAGDLIGASTFESFIQKDKPTIDALNEAGLEVSAVGNHELDGGYADLVDRVMAPYDPDTNPLGGAQWEYIAANIDEPGDQDEIAETWTRTFGDVEVGFVGAVTEDLPSLVSPAGIEGLTVTDIVDATNAAAADLRADGADVVVLLVHEGSPSTDCATMTDPQTTWGNIVTGVDENVDAIVSGHTHLAYNCKFPVQEWVDEGRDVTERPVVSAGQYGTNLNQLVFTVDPATGEVTGLTQKIVALKANATTFNFPADPAVTQIVDKAVADAETLGAEPLGSIAGGFNRAKLQNGTTENRGGESTLGNLVAEVQRWATETPEAGAAQIAFMNPGGLRADMLGGITGETAYPKTLTYKQAASVQPFANTLVNMELTGAQIETVLEQQWQRDASGNVPSRPFLRLGVSEGFTYTYYEYDDPSPTLPADAKLGEVTGMWLEGEPLDPAATYSVTVNSFLASGGDNFRVFANGTSKADTGKIDLQAMVDYMAEFAAEEPLPVDYSQRAVEIAFPGGAPTEYEPGDTVAFDVASWAMSAPADLEDAELTVKLGDTVLGTFPVDNTIGTAVFDDYGTASVSVVLPNGVTTGDHELVLTGATTGTKVVLPITVVPTPEATVSVDDVTATYGEDAVVSVTVTGNRTDPSGSVEVLAGDTSLGLAELDRNGVAAVTLDIDSLEPAEYVLTAVYSGDATYPEVSADFTLTVEKAASLLDVTVEPGTTVERRERVRVVAEVSGPDGVEPTGVVRFENGGEVTEVELSDGVAVFHTSWKKVGTQTVVVTYPGNGVLEPSSTEVVIQVTKR